MRSCTLSHGLNQISCRWFYALWKWSINSVDKNWTSFGIDPISGISIVWWAFIIKSTASDCTPSLTCMAAVDYLLWSIVLTWCRLRAAFQTAMTNRVRARIVRLWPVAALKKWGKGNTQKNVKTNVRILLWISMKLVHMLTCSLPPHTVDHSQVDDDGFQAATDVTALNDYYDRIAWPAWSKTSDLVNPIFLERRQLTPSSVRYAACRVDNSSMIIFSPAT